MILLVEEPNEVLKVVISKIFSETIAPQSNQIRLYYKGQPHELELLSVEYAALISLEINKVF